jgi:alpha-pyrone synthase
LPETTAYLNRNSTAAPNRDVYDVFVIFAGQMLASPRLRAVFRRRSSRADIARRYSSLNPGQGSGSFSSHGANELYRQGSLPNTARRMDLFEQCAPVLMRKAVDRLALNAKKRSGMTHMLVTCCTGLYAPGLTAETIHFHAV